MATKRNIRQQQRDRDRIKQGRPNCHICGQAINYEADWLDPQSFVVDHVIPLAKNGPDTLENKRAAHRSCNSSKRARLVAPIVRRSGALG
jgi:5-methylcytosine-specific restriction endonuclease McrA